MDVGKRLLRKPVQTFLWQIVLIAMALLLGIGGALTYSALQLPATLNNHHTTVAAQTKKSTKDQDNHWATTPASLLPEQLEALQDLDMVELVDLRTLTGAYIPSMTAQVGLTKWGNLHAMNYDSISSRHLNDSYDHVILTGRMEKVWMVDESGGIPTDLSAMGGGSAVKMRYAYGVLEIEEILVANPAYDFFATEEFTSYCGKVYVQAMVYDETGENPFREGARYIVSGRYDPSCHSRVGHTPSDSDFYPWVTLESGIIDATYCFFTDEGLIRYQHTESHYDASQNISVLESVEEPVLMAAQLTGTTEEFLTEHPAWQAELEKYTMAQHTFPVLGTECVESMQYFVTNAATITQGRTFAREEYDTGAKVCLISEALALTGNITAGDTISLSQYLCGNYAEGNLSLYDGTGTLLNDPSVGSVPFPHGLTTRDEQFTVVGIYRLERSWEQSAFSFTPNTVFMPQKAQIEGGFGGGSTAVQEMLTHYRIDETTGYLEKVEFLEEVVYNNGSYGVYLSVKLKNGRMQEFLDALPELGLTDHVFLTFDQGYDAAWESIQTVIRAAEKLLVIAVAGWALLLMLYVVLYQSRQRHNLGIMRSVGASPQQARRYLFSGGIIPAAIGVCVGTALSGAVTHAIQDNLIDLALAQVSSNAHSGGMALDSASIGTMLGESVLSVSGLVILAMLQLAVIAFVLWVHARILANKKPWKLLGV